MKNNLPKNCYWCGTPLTKETNKREHVPPLSFFPKNYRDKLITVPACSDHNTNLSALDDHFQVYIKAMADSQVAVDDFKDRVVRGLNRKEAKKFVEHLSANSFYKNIDGERKLITRIDANYTQKFFEKVLRGIYFYHNETPAIGLVQGISPLFTNEDYNILELFDQLLDDLNAEALFEGDYNNPEVFKYKYYTIPHVNYFVAILTFYKSVEIIGWVIPKSNMRVK